MEILPIILVVDDSLTMRSAIRRELGPDRYEIVEASDGMVALELIEKGLRPALVTLDVEMPRLDGFETCAALFGPRFSPRLTGAAHARIPVVFITARNSLEERRRGFELGAIDFISKNFEPGSLAALVHRQLRPNDRLRGINVLLVDDSASIRSVVAKALREEGVEVTQAEDGLRAFEILCDRMSETDLVITDIAMPGLDGHQLCRRIRRELGLVELPVIFFTGTDQEQRLLAFGSGATDCLAKPFIKEQMVARILVHLEKLQLHRRLQRSVAELRHALDRQGEMLATLSHDMRSPLNGIMGFSELLLGDARRDAEERESLEMIQHSGQLLLTLIDDVLTLARQESPQAELELHPLRLADLASRSAGIVRHLVKIKQQEFVFENRVPDAIVNGHAESLVRVFNNLLSNAVKFTPTGGRVTFRLEASGSTQVAITITDTGIGMPADKLMLLFDRYTRLSQPGTAGEAGTGLGMSIVKEFVDQHRGHISVSSRPGEGTRFRVVLPRCAERPTSSTDRSPAPRTTDGHKERLAGRMSGLRVLLAEDNPVNQAVTRAIRAALAPGPIIIGLTGNDRESDRARCLVAGMNDHLAKPFSPTALFETIVRHLEPPIEPTLKTAES